MPSQPITPTKSSVVCIKMCDSVYFVIICLFICICVCVTEILGLLCSVLDWCWNFIPPTQDHVCLYNVWDGPHCRMIALQTATISHAVCNAEAPLWSSFHPPALNLLPLPSFAHAINGNLHKHCRCSENLRWDHLQEKVCIGWQSVSFFAQGSCTLNQQDVFLPRTPSEI